MTWLFQAFIYLILFANTNHGFNLLDTSMFKRTFEIGDEVYPKVNSLTSIETQLPFSYYSLPYCLPHGGVKVSSMNLGQLLLGDQVMNSPYRFKMNANETYFLCVKDPITGDEVKLLKQRINDLYQVNMILDYLPVVRFVNQNGYHIQWTGFPVGYRPSYSKDDYYIINHLKFRVLLNKREAYGIQIIGNGEEDLGIIKKAVTAYSFEIVGFEVVPCSVKHNLKDLSKLQMYETIQPINCPEDIENSQIIQENETIVFSYEVEFVTSDIKWSSRWDSYLRLRSAKVHWFSILNSAIAIFILAGIVVGIYLRSVRTELTQYQEPDKESTKLPGWKLVVGDVFREPGYSKLLCVMVGDGIQLTITALATILLAALGFISTVSRGVLLTSFILLYLLFSVGAGYASVRLWRTVKGSSEGWKSVCLSVASFFPGIILLILTFSSILLSKANSTAISVSSFFIALSLWFCISVPLTLFGGFIATKANMIQYPVQTAQIPREIPARKCLPWMLVLGAGILPFGTVLIEFFMILSSIWLGRFYLEFGFLLVALVLHTLVSAIVSVILTYTRLRVEDWQWWWKAFFASGSVGIYMFLFSIHYLVFDLRGLSGHVSAALYMGYSLIIAVAFTLASGTVGFLVSFYFVHCLYSSAKVDC